MRSRRPREAREPLERDPIAEFQAGWRQPGPRSGGDRSGKERDRPKPGERGTPADRPWPTGRQVEGDPAGRPGQAASQAEQPTPERLRRDDPLAETDPGRPASEVVGGDLDRERSEERRVG